jgi:hypothetical protein
VKAIVILSAVLVLSCSPPVFIVINGNSFSPSAEHLSQRFILLTEQSHYDAQAVAVLLNKRKREQLRAELSHINDLPSKKFIQSIQLLIHRKYEDAYNLLATMPEDGFDCQVLMLKTDCLYLLNDMSVDFKKEYQRAWDCSTDAEVKAIAKSRFRLVNYGY